MGIEYAHWLFVEDPTWTGSLDVARRVDNALRQRGLVAEEPALSAVTGWRKTRIRRTLDRLNQMPGTLLAEYPEVLGDAVESVMGRSFYEEGSLGDRYFQRIQLVVGEDYRVYFGMESGAGQLLDAAGLETYSESRSNVQLPQLMCLAPGTQDATPLTAFEPGDRVRMPRPFEGLWRSGLGLDCGKDLPSLVEDVLELPARDFVEQLEEAFGTPLIEVGNVY